MKTLKEVLSRIDKETLSQVFSDLSRFKRNGDLVVSCWGTSIFPEEAIDVLIEPEERLKRRKVVRDINLAQWSDSCEGFMSLGNQGFPVEEFINNSNFRCYSCQLLYSTFYQRIRAFYKTYNKLPTLIWDNTLKFKEELEIEKKKLKIVNKNIKYDCGSYTENYIDYPTWGYPEYQKVFYKK